MLATGSVYPLGPMNGTDPIADVGTLAVRALLVTALVLHCVHETPVMAHPQRP